MPQHRLRLTDDVISAQVTLSARCSRTRTSSLSIAGLDLSDIDDATAAAARARQRAADRSPRRHWIGNQLVRATASND